MVEKPQQKQSIIFIAINGTFAYNNNNEVLNRQYLHHAVHQVYRGYRPCSLCSQRCCNHSRCMLKNYLMPSHSISLYRGPFYVYLLINYGSRLPTPLMAFTTTSKWRLMSILN